MREILKKLLTEPDKAFSLFVLTVLSIVTIPITLKEAFTRQIKYYKLNGFIFEEIASYLVTITLMFIIFLCIIHANRIFNIFSDILYLIIPALEKYLGLAPVSQLDTGTGVSMPIATPKKKKKKKTEEPFPYVRGKRVDKQPQNTEESKGSIEPLEEKENTDVGKS
ncbi:MAG: hypothetical protein AAF518_14500 [Spirochaetota bacterium]